MSKCIETGCKTVSCFGITKGEVLYCKKHKRAEMIDVKNRICNFEGCTTTCPAFGEKGGIGTHCKKHKSENMIDVKTKRCESTGCESLAPVFNLKGEKRGRFCLIHKLDGMINVRHKRCQYADCETQPNYGEKGGQSTFCQKHKSEGMVDVVHKYCEYPGCESIGPAFGKKGGKGRFCSKHKLEGMVNVTNKRCEHEGCDSQIVFGEKGGKPRFCKLHKLEGMIDVKNKRCQHDDCDIIATFNIKGENPQFCIKHKTDIMVNVRHIVCDQDSCIRGATYGTPGIKESKCNKHRLPGMIRRSNAKCKTPACKEIAIWGSNWIPKHCETHKLEDEHNLIENPCSSCGLMYILDKDQKCEMCNPISFATVRLAKQNALMNYLDAHGLKGSSTDTIIENGQCGKERPDRVFDFGDKIVILECDEHQHRDRACLCEQARMVNLGQSYGGIPVYFIRWNPDDYTPENSKKEPEALSKRHKLVCDLIINIEKGKYELPLALVSAFYMYYDEWSCLQDAKWEIITAFVS